MGASIDEIELRLTVLHECLSNFLDWFEHFVLFDYPAHQQHTYHLVVCLYHPKLKKIFYTKIYLDNICKFYIKIIPDRIRLVGFG